MSEHAQFGSPSSAEREIRCPGSTAFPENQVPGESSIYADEGTAAHTLASRCLELKVPAHTYIDTQIVVGKNVFEVTEEFAAHVQTYVDDVERRATGGQLMIEQRVQIEETGAFGTSDAIIASPPGAAVDGEVSDLKFGRGEQVYAWSYATEDAPFTLEMYKVDESELPDVVEPNYQLMLYALGSLEILRMLVEKLRRIRLVINQPRLGHVSELVVTVEILERFGAYAAEAKAFAERARQHTRRDTPEFLTYLHPGEKQCRWCRAMAVCPKLAAQVAQEVGAEFELIESTNTAPLPNLKGLSRAFRVIPMIRDWIREVEARANTIVAGGGEIIGVDKKPMKFVEGKQGARAWTNEKEAEAALLGQLIEADAYAPRKIISASQAAKKLDKKKTATVWKDVFAPLIKRPPGRPMLVLGSDPRPPFSGAAKGEEFDEIEADEE